MATRVEVFSYDGGTIRAGYDYDDSDQVTAIWCENHTAHTVTVKASGQTFTFPSSGILVPLDLYVSREINEGEEFVTFPLQVKVA